MTIFGDGDLALSKESDGTIRAAGYKLDTIFGVNMMPMSSFPTQRGGGRGETNKETILDKLQGDFAVPAGLLYLNTVSPHTNIVKDAEVAPNQLIDRLVNLMSPTDEKKQKNTRKKMTKLSAKNKTAPKQSATKKSQTKKNSNRTTRKQTHKSQM